MALSQGYINQPDGQFVQIGRGCAFFAFIDPATGLPDADGYQDMLNLSSFAVSVEDEEFEHFSTRRGLKVRDAKLILSRQADIQITIDQYTLSIANLWYGGVKSGLVNEDLSVRMTTAITDEPVTGISATDELVPGRWYELRNSSNERLFGVLPAGITISVTLNGSPIAGDSSAYFELLPRFGLIRVRSNSAGRFVDADNNRIGDDNLAADALLATFSMAAQDVGDYDIVEKVTAFENVVEGAIKFIQADSRGSGQEIEHQFHRVTLSPTDSLEHISDEPIAMSFSGSIEENELADENSPYVTSRLVTPRTATP